MESYNKTKMLENALKNTITLAHKPTPTRTLKKNDKKNRINSSYYLNRLSLLWKLWI